MRLLRTLLIGLLLVAVLAGAAVLALILLVNPDRVKSELEQATLRATGRTLSFAGPVHLHFGGSPGIEADGVSLSNPPGYSRPELATFKSIRAELALLPLLTGATEIDSLVLDGPDIRLERLPDGTPNWVFGRPKMSPAQPGAAPTAPAPVPAGPPPGVEIHAVTITDGQIDWRGGTVPNAVLGITRLTATEAGPQAPLDVAGEMSWRNIPFTLSAHTGGLDRLTGGPVTLVAGAWPVALNLTAADAALSVEGGINHPDEGRGFAFHVTGHAADLAALAALAPDAGLPPLKDVNVTAQLADAPDGGIRASQVSLKIGTSDLGALLPGLTLKQVLLAAPGPGQQAQINIDATLGAEPLTLSGTAVEPNQLGADSVLQVALNAEAAGGSLSARGAVPTRLGGQGLDVQVDGHIPDLSALSSLAGRRLPAMQDVTLTGHALDAGPGQQGIALHDFTLHAAPGDLAGNAILVWAPRPSLTGALSSSQLDLDLLQRGGMPGAPAPAVPTPDTAPLAPAPAAVAATGRVIPDTQLPFGLVRGADADLDLTGRRVLLGGETYRDATAHLTMAAGKLAITPFRVTAPAGVMTGSIAIDAAAGNPRVTLVLRSPAIAAAALVKLASLPGAASGPVQIDANLIGAGATPHAIAATLGGHLGLSMIGGHVSASLLDALGAVALNGTGIPLGDGGADIRCFATRIDFAAGTGQVAALALDTSRLSLSGTGQIDLGDETLDLHLRPSVQLAGTSAAAPVMLTGTLSAPHAELDRLPGGRVGLTIGSLLGTGPADSGCVGKLALARGGMAGPMPAASPPPGQKSKKPIDLLKSLFH